MQEATFINAFCNSWRFCSFLLLLLQLLDEFAGVFKIRTESQLYFTTGSLQGVGNFASAIIIILLLPPPASCSPAAAAPSLSH